MEGNGWNMRDQHINFFTENWYFLKSTRQHFFCGLVLVISGVPVSKHGQVRFQDFWARALVLIEKKIIVTIIKHDSHFALANDN